MMRHRRPAWSPSPPPHRRPVDVTIRRAFPDDHVTLVRLAALDGAAPPAGDALVAEVAGEPWAALALDDGQVVADPFRPTDQLVALLRARAQQLRAPGARLAPALRRLVPLLGGH